MHLPFDVNQLGRLARRDLQRACLQFLNSCSGNVSGVLEALKREPPHEWCPDLLPMLQWLFESPKTESPLPTTEHGLSRLLAPACVASSPMLLTKKTLIPGDEISEVLARRIGDPLLVIPSEGERLVSLDEAEFLLGSNLGYLRGSREIVRAKRATKGEQESIRCTFRHFTEVLTHAHIDEAMAQLLKYRFEKLLTASNHNLPEMLVRLRELSPDAESCVWHEVIEYQRRISLPPGRCPSPLSLRNRLQDLGITLEGEHIARLLHLAADLHQRTQPDPDVDHGDVQASLEELEEYLSWELPLVDLPKYRSMTGIRFLNTALLQLAAGGTGSNWPSNLQSELIEFRESFLKRLHSRPFDVLSTLRPTELIHRGLARQHNQLLAGLGDPDWLLRAWQELDAELCALLENALAEETGSPTVPSIDDGQDDWSADLEEEYESAQEFFDIGDDSLITIDPLSVPDDASADVPGSDNQADDGIGRPPPPVPFGELEELHLTSELAGGGGREIDPGCKATTPARAQDKPGLDRRASARELEKVVRELEALELSRRTSFSATDGLAELMPAEGEDWLNDSENFELPEPPSEAKLSPAPRRTRFSVDDLAPSVDDWETPCEHEVDK